MQWAVHACGLIGNEQTAPVLNLKVRLNHIKIGSATPRNMYPLDTQQRRVDLMRGFRVLWVFSTQRVFKR